MKPEEKDIRGFLADTFSEYEPVPKRDIWEEIEAEIEEKRPKGWTWGYSLAVACAALLLAIYLFRPVKKTREENLVQNSESIQPQEDSATLYTEKTLVPREESEAESPKEVLPSTPISPPRELVESPQNVSPKPQLKKAVGESSEPLYAVIEKQDDSLSEQVGDESHASEEVLEVIAITEPSEFSQPNLTEDTTLLPPPNMSTMEVPALATQEENKGGFSLKELSFEKALMAASQEIDKRFDDAPISAREVEENGETIRTLRFKIGGFSITHKRKVKSSKVKRT